MIDTHSHLHVSEFDADRAMVIDRARKAGVTAFVNVGFDKTGNLQALELAQKYTDIYATFGIHPHEADQYSDELFAQYEKMLREEKNLAAREHRSAKIVAIGETGLDFFKNRKPREVQEKSFRAQVIFAKAMDLPCIVHCRDAFPETLQILSQEKIERVVFHCFTGDSGIAEAIVRRGFYLSFTGIITFPSASHIQKAIVHIPEDSFFIETDCPFLAPQPVRGKRNEPAFLRYTLDFIAHMRNISPEKLDAIIEESTRRFFNLPT